MIYIRHPRSDLDKEIDAMLDVAEDVTKDSIVESIRMDGRKGRRAVSRDAFIKAGLNLLLHNVTRPSDREICAEAKRSVRSFYQIFDSTEEYWMEVFRTYEASIKAKIAETLEGGDGYTIMRLIVLGKK